MSRQARSHSFVSVERDVVPSRGTKLGSPLPSQQHTHPALLSLQQAAGAGGLVALQCTGKDLRGPLWAQARIAGPAPAASKITGAQTVPVHLGLYLELLLEMVLAKCHTHLGRFKSKKRRWFCGRELGSPQTWGRSPGLHSAWGSSPPHSSLGGSCRWGHSLLASWRHVSLTPTDFLPEPSILWSALKEYGTGLLSSQLRTAFEPSKPASLLLSPAPPAAAAPSPSLFGSQCRRHMSFGVLTCHGGAEQHPPTSSVPYLC